MRADDLLCGNYSDVLVNHQRCAVLRVGIETWGTRHWCRPSTADIRGVIATAINRKRGARIRDCKDVCSRQSDSIGIAICSEVHMLNVLHCSYTRQVQVPALHEQG